MSRLNATFARLRSEGRQGLVSYIVAGDPSPSGTVELLHQLVVAGADVLRWVFRFLTRWLRAR